MIKLRINIAKTSCYNFNALDLAFNDNATTNNRPDLFIISSFFLLIVFNVCLNKKSPYTWLFGLTSVSHKLFSFLVSDLNVLIVALLN